MSRATPFGLHPASDLAGQVQRLCLAPASCQQAVRHSCASRVKATPNILTRSPWWALRLPVLPLTPMDANHGWKPLDLSDWDSLVMTKEFKVEWVSSGCLVVCGPSDEMQDINRKNLDHDQETEWGKDYCRIG